MLLLLPKTRVARCSAIFLTEYIFEVRSGSRSQAAAAGLAAGGEPVLRSGPAALGWSAAARCADRKMRAPPRSGARLAICGWSRRAFKRDLDAVGGGGQELRRFTLNHAGFTIPPDSLGLAGRDELEFGHGFFDLPSV